MDHSSFAFICDKICDNPVFHNDLNHSQAPVDYKLLVSQAHLCLNGNGGSLHIIAHFFNISSKVDIVHYFLVVNDAHYLQCVHKAQSKIIQINA